NLSYEGAGAEGEARGEGLVDLVLAEVRLAGLSPDEGDGAVGDIGGFQGGRGGAGRGGGDLVAAGGLLTGVVDEDAVVVGDPGPSRVAFIRPRERAPGTD
ncbi:MAG: hypothetical protein COZ06_33100, partial [Armatimonadetes bacterium CG_4_10_14_3_um_filter_66_18]